MTTAVLEAKTADFDVEDVEYLRHGDKPLLARIYKPRGAGPFPAMVECHGGAWCQSDRLTEKLRHQAHGVARHRVDRARFPLRQRGPVSGLGAGHQLRGALGEGAMRARSRPGPTSSASPASRAAGISRCWSPCGRNDPRYAAIPLPAGTPAQDASVRCVIMSWPVINPLSRYRHAKRALQAPIRRTGRSPSSPGRTPIGSTRPTWPRATRCWRSSAARRSLTPPAVWFQGRGDTMHDYKDAESSFDGNEPQRFVANYRKAGGDDRARIHRHGRGIPAIRRTCRRPATCSTAWWRSSEKRDALITSAQAATH